MAQADFTPVGKELTGRKVLAITVGFFAVIIAVNLFMAFKAVGTFPGLEVKNSYVASGDKRPLVIDGRVRAAPDGKHGFALYWIVQRCAAGLKEINMEQSYTQADLVLNLTINGEETPIAKNASAMPSIPIIVNPKIVKKHTRLLAKVDQDLHKLNEKYEADAARAAAKKNKEENESKDNKKSLKRESETTDKDAKKAKK